MARRNLLLRKVGKLPLTNKQTNQPTLPDLCVFLSPPSRFLSLILEPCEAGAGNLLGLAISSAFCSLLRI